jgi:hypothetical protein
MEALRNVDKLFFYAGSRGVDHQEVLDAGVGEVVKT